MIFSGRCHDRPRSSFQDRYFRACSHARPCAPKPKLDARLCRQSGSGGRKARACSRPMREGLRQRIFSCAGSAIAPLMKHLGHCSQRVTPCIKQAWSVVSLRGRSPATVPAGLFSEPRGSSAAAIEGWLTGRSRVELDARRAGFLVQPLQRLEGATYFPSICWPISAIAR